MAFVVGPSAVHAQEQLPGRGLAGVRSRRGSLVVLVLREQRRLTHSLRREHAAFGSSGRSQRRTAADLSSHPAPIDR